MAVNQPLIIQAKRSSISLLIQPVNNKQLNMTAQALALEKLGRSVNLDFLVMAPETLNTMNDSLYVQPPFRPILMLTFASLSTHVNLSQLNTSAQSLRCASMVLGLTRIEKACARIEIILNLCIDLHHSGFDLHQICEILSYVVKETHMHFQLAKTAFTSFYDLPLLSPREDASDSSGESNMF
jgi:hypothetical protein